MIESPEIEIKSPTLKDVKNVQLQNNYSNKILYTIFNQIERVESKLEPYHYYMKSQPQSIDKIKPLFKLFDISNRNLGFRIEQSGTDINQTQDAVATLIYTITKNFIGEPVQFQE